VSDDGDFLRRWSRRKVASRAGETLESDAPPAPAVVPVETGTQAEARAPDPLPPVESLTPESDFAPFMQPGVDPGVKREALKTLLRDPRFNVMDGLDVYIDDYSKPDPLPVEWLGQLKQMERLGHYIEPEEKPESVAKEGEAAPEAPAGEPQKAMHEEPVSFPEKAPSSDTGSKDAPAPE
jgi:hypothetical protein